jgi:hypothetical protein
LDRKLFHSNDLALLWGITNRNTLYTSIKRYVQKGILIPIFKGLYSTMPLEQLDPIDLGQAIIHRYAYLSTESVLAEAGAITQITYSYTFVSDQSKRLSIGPWSFLVRQMKDESLHNPTGVQMRDSTFVATVERAAADMLYFNPRYHFDVRERIDFEKVKAIQEEVGYQ